MRRIDYGPMPATFMHASLRQLLLAVILLGIVGLQVELALLRHAESLTQWIPHVALMIGLLSTLAVYIRPGTLDAQDFPGRHVDLPCCGSVGRVSALQG